MTLSGGYEIGTVSLTTGTKAITGVGTSWVLYGIQAGDHFLRDGYIGVIDTVDSDTGITLKDNWPGSTLSGATYRIEAIPYAVRVQGDLRNQLNQLGSNGNINQFVGLTFDNNKLIATDDSAALTQYDLSAAGLAMAAAASAMAQRDLISMQGTDIASAATLNLGAATGDLVQVTGTVTTTAITLAQGAERWVVATGAWPITVSTGLVLNNNGANYVCTAGDLILFRGFAAGVVKGWIIPASSVGGPASWSYL